LNRAHSLHFFLADFSCENKFFSNFFCILTRILQNDKRIELKNMYDPKLNLNSILDNSTEESHSGGDTLDPRALSSVLISVKMIQSQEDSNQADPHTRLLELMHSREIKALLDAANLLGCRENIPAHEALQKVILNLQEIDKLWNQVLMKEGLERLSSQFH